MDGKEKEKEKEKKKGKEKGMEEILKGTKILLLMGAVAQLVVLVAMACDLVGGLVKAKVRGDFAESELLKRTGSKFCLYEGSMLIALCVDMLVHFTHLYEHLGLPPVMVHLPLVSFAMAVFWCAVEYLSMRERATDKIHSRIAKVEKLAATMFTKDELVEMLSGAFAAAREKERETKEEEGNAKNEEGRRKEAGNGAAAVQRQTQRRKNGE